MFAIQIKNLSKKYKDFEALKDINLEIKSWDFFALLGINGAWKTTLIGILTDLIKKTSWEVKIYGHNTEIEKEKAKEMIGIVPQEFNLDIWSRVWDTLIINAGFQGVQKEKAEKKAEELLKKLSLWEKRNNTVRELSWGMKRRLMIARALMHSPRLLILDEPTAWVDLNLRKSTREFLQEINKWGTTILLTTHYLEEVEILCNTLAFISHGKIIEHTSKRDFFKKIDTSRFEVSLKNEMKSIPSCLQKYKTELVNSKKIIVYIPKRETLNNFFDSIQKEKIEIENIENVTNELEELFYKLTK